MEQPEDLDALKARIADLVNSHRLREARDMCRALRPVHPQDPWLPTMLAYVLLVCVDNEGAGEAAEAALALGSDDPLAGVVLGISLRNRGRHEEALEALLAVHRRAPDQLDAATMAIEEAVAAHGIDAARAVYEEVFARQPEHAVNLCWGELLYGAGRSDEMPPGVVMASLMSVRDWLARRGQAPEFSAAPETIHLEEPPVFGEPAELFKEQVQGYAPYACTLRGATIFARSSLVLMPDGAVLNDTAADARFGRFLVLSHDPMVRHREDDQLLLDTGNYRVEPLEAGIMLSGWASQHFGHWMPEYIARLAYLERHPRFAELPIIVDSDMPPQHLEYLSLMVPNRIVQIPPDGGLRCDELVVASPTCFFPVLLADDHLVPPQHQGGLPTDGFRFIRDRILQRLPPTGERGRRLYLSRSTRQWRRLLNEDEIARALAARGFEVLLPEELSLEDQVRMYQSADVVVAPNGSSVLNAMFAPQDQKLVILSQRGLFNWATFYGPMREMGYDMTFVCGDEETGNKHGDYAIPLDRLLTALDAPRA